MHPWTVAATTPEKPALIMAETGQVVSYAALMQRANQAAHLFASCGLGVGDTVAFFLENQWRYPELCWAAKNSGLYYVGVSSHLNAADAAYVVDNSDAKLLVTSPTLAAEAQEVAARLGAHITYLMIDEAEPPFLSYESLLAGQPATPLAARPRGASMLYSSGTTGRPKGVRVPLVDVPPTVPPQRHGMLLDKFGFDSDTVFLNPGPFYHAAPLRMMMAVHRMGGTVIGFGSFDAATTLSAITAYRGTHGFFVPTMFVRMLRLSQDARGAADVSSMICAIHAAAPCPRQVKEAMIDWWGPVLWELYGGTEGVGHTFISSPEWLQHRGSVGKPTAGCVLKILDDEGRELGPNQPGRIFMHNGRPFSYYKDEDKTRSVYDAYGRATLGDIGYVDEEGYLYLTDRQAHMIISGGVNIYPQEAENVLIEHPAVADVAVIGVPHPEFGEEVKAVVEPVHPVADPAALEAEIIAFCRARLSTIKCPRSVDFVRELPRNDAGKLVKRLLKQRYWAGHESVII